MSHKTKCLNSVQSQVYNVDISHLFQQSIVQLSASQAFSVHVHVSAIVEGVRFLLCTSADTKLSSFSSKSTYMQAG